MITIIFTPEQIASAHAKAMGFVASGQVHRRDDATLNYDEAGRLRLTETYGGSMSFYVIGDVSDLSVGVSVQLSVVE